MFIEITCITDAYDRKTSKRLINIKHIIYIKPSRHNYHYENASTVIVRDGSEHLEFACAESYNEIKNKMVSRLKEIGIEIDRFELMDFEE